MIKSLEKIRSNDNNKRLQNKIIDTFLILAAGIILGVLSKWLDNLSINDSIGWQHLIGLLDLRNVFSSLGIWLLFALIISFYSSSPFRASLNVFVFFMGMCLSYHFYTILFSGFNPKSYMMFWYLITLISPLLAFICWYAKGRGKLSFWIDVFILAAMFFVSFSFGMWYIDIKSVIDLLIFLSAFLLLYKDVKSSVCSVLISIVLAFLIRIIIF